MLGRYRFAIEGHDYTLTSDPFEVTAATLVGAAARVAANVQLSVGVDVPHGYRLIHDVGSSNGRVPLRDATVDVVFIDAELAETLREDVVLDSEGRALLTEIPSDAVSVRITDQHGNQGQWAIE